MGPQGSAKTALCLSQSLLNCAFFEYGLGVRGGAGRVRTARAKFELELDKIKKC